MARAALKLGVRELAQAAKVSPATVTRIEGDQPANAATLSAIAGALEAAGVEFIAENGGGAGVRLRSASSPGDTLAPPSFASTITTALDAMPGKAAEGRGPEDSASEDQPDDGAQGSGMRREK